MWTRYYPAHADQLDFLCQLKKQFLNKLRHLTRIWDLWTRVFDEANPILPGSLCSERYLESYFEKKRSNMDHIITNPKYLDSPCQELSNSGLGIAATLLVCWGIDFLCVSTYWGSNQTVQTKRHFFWLLFDNYPQSCCTLVEQICQCCFQRWRPATGRDGVIQLDSM